MKEERNWKELFPKMYLLGLLFWGIFLVLFCLTDDCRRAIIGTVGLIMAIPILRDYVL